MKKKLLLGFVFLSLLFVVLSVAYYTSPPVSGDKWYYAQGFSVGDGHELTLLLTNVLNLMPFGETVVFWFLSLFFVWSMYYFLKPFVRYAWIVCLLAPFTSVPHYLIPSGIYAQSFAISLFLIGVGLFFRKHYSLSALLFTMMFFSHSWTGTIFLFVFGIYLLIWQRSLVTKMLVRFIPLLIVVCIFCQFYYGMLIGAAHFAYPSSPLPEQEQGLIRETLVIPVLAIVGFFICVKEWIKCPHLQIIILWTIACLVGVFSFTELADRFLAMIPFLPMAVVASSWILTKCDGRG